MFKIRIYQCEKALVDEKVCRSSGPCLENYWVLSSWMSKGPISTLFAGVSAFSRFPFVLRSGPLKGIKALFSHSVRNLNKNMHRTTQNFDLLDSVASDDLDLTRGHRRLRNHLEVSNTRPIPFHRLCFNDTTNMLVDANDDRWQKICS